MLTHPRLRIVFVVSLILLGAMAVFAQGNQPDRLAEEKKERDATVGVISYKDEETNGKKWAFFYLVDLGLREIETNAPFLYVISVDGRGEDYPLKPERTYKAHMKDGQVESILIGGTRIRMKEWGMTGTSQTWSCESRLSPEGGHWERKQDGGFQCAPGSKETVRWKADKGSKQEAARANQNQTVPPCEEQDRFHDTTLTLVTTVKPAQGLKWTMDDAPSFFAAQLLDYLNKNTSNITFREASGVAPNFYINVTMSQTSEGTQQNQVWIEIVGKDGLILKANSGESPFTDMREAFNRAGSGTLRWFELGWHHPPPCVKRDGIVLNQ